MLFQHWRVTSQQREITLAETPPTALIGIVSNKNIVVMHYPFLIHRACTPSENHTSYPESTIGKIDEAAIVCFKVIHLKELHAYDFSTQNLYDWVTDISPNTGIDLVDYIKLTKILLNHEKSIDKSSGTAWCLTRHILLLPF